MPSAHEHFEPGARIREYEIIERIARGGMGAVYRARHVYLEEERAIKVVLPGMSEKEGTVERFIREARILVRLRHPNLVQLHEFGTLEDGSFFMVMELIRGESVQQRLQRVQRIPFGQAINVIREAGSGLAAAHAQGIVHRDIAPDNLLLVATAEGRELTKIVDFGIAKPFAEESQLQTLATNMFIGKPQYSSPEQCGILEGGQVIDHRSDIYSLGVTFYQMVTGTLPFQAPNPIGYLFKHVNEVPQHPASHFPDGQFPPALDRIIMRTLEKKRDDRYGSMQELVHELDQLPPQADGTESGVVPEQISEVIPRPPLRDITGLIDARRREGGTGAPGTGTDAGSPGEHVAREVLVHRMMLERKYSQAIKLLVPLVESDPENLNWRKLLDKARLDKTLKALRRAKRLIADRRFDEAASLLGQLEAEPNRTGRTTTQIRKVVELLQAARGASTPPSEASPTPDQPADERTAVDQPAPSPAEISPPHAAIIDRDLGEAALLQGKGRLQAALEKVMSVLGLDPENEKARELEISIRVSIEERDLARRLAQHVKKVVSLLTSNSLPELNGALRDLRAVAAESSAEREVESLVTDLAALGETMQAGMSESAFDLAGRHSLLRPYDGVLRNLARKSADEKQRLAFNQHLAAGREAAARRRWKEANKHLDLALEVAPDDAARNELLAMRTQVESQSGSEAKVRSLLYKIELAYRMQSWDEVIRLSSQALGAEFASILGGEEADQIRKTDEHARLARIQGAETRAAQLRRDGNNGAAYELYRRILEWDPQHPEARENVVALDPARSRFRSFCEQAESLFAQERWEEAAQSWRDANTLVPGDPDVARRLSDAEGLHQAETSLRDEFRATASEYRKLASAGRVHDAEATLARCTLPPQAGNRLDDLRLELVALQSDLRRRIEIEATRQKLITDFITSARKLFGDGHLEDALVKARDLLTAVPGQREAAELVGTIEGVLEKEHRNRDAFSRLTRQCRDFIAAGDLEAAQTTMLMCQSVFEPGLRLDDLNMELLALQADLHGAIERSKTRG
ncbi:MAG: protein kinase [Acidobacteria bacterium]|nr:protein kinase [Acidobacteriota bacterium]